MTIAKPAWKKTKALFAKDDNLSFFRGGSSGGSAPRPLTDQEKFDLLAGRDQGCCPSCQVTSQDPGRACDNPTCDVGIQSAEQGSADE